MNNKLIVGIIFIFLGMNLIILPLWFPNSPVTHEVKCYDRYSNEIIGQKCLTTDYKGNIFLIALLGYVLIMFGGFFIGLGAVE